MITIKIMDGIECIVLDEGIIILEKDLKQISKNTQMPEYFTNIQESKENRYYNKVLDEIKKKFGEK